MSQQLGSEVERQGKANKSTTPRAALSFQRKEEELPWVGFEPTTLMYIRAVMPHRLLSGSHNIQAKNALLFETGSHVETRTQSYQVAVSVSKFKQKRHIVCIDKPRR